MDDITSNNAPRIVIVKDFKIDADYAAWLSEIKRRYISAQIKASIKINTEKLCVNWSVGRDLVMRKAEERWGSGVVEQLSFDLKEAFPQEKGFSSRNMWRMKQWYLFFSTTEANEKLTRLVAELQKVESPYPINVPQVVAVLNVEPCFPIVLGMIPWGHQTDIVSKCKSIDEAMFYLRESILGGWSRQTLDNSLKANLYKSRDKAISNFHALSLSGASPNFSAGWLCAAETALRRRRPRPRKPDRARRGPAGRRERL